MDPGNRLNGSLQFKQSKGIQHELENNRAIFEFAPETPHGSGQNPPMIKAHRHPDEDAIFGGRNRSIVIDPFRHQLGFIEKFIALKDLLENKVE